MTDGWIPKTELGRKVLNGEYANIDEVLALGKPILEAEIVDYFIPDLAKEKLEVRNTQRSTDSGRKMQFRVLMLVGDKNGHYGIGVGKHTEMTPAVNNSLRDAKLKLTRVEMGCGSWECFCGEKHSLPIKVEGRQSSVKVGLMPAPKGIGLACNPVVRKILQFAGVHDVWSFSRGNTANTFNTAFAVRNALDSLMSIRVDDWANYTGKVDEEKAAHAAQAEKS